MEHTGLADEARALAPHALAALKVRGYPEASLVVLAVHNPFTARTSRRRVIAWQIGRSSASGDSPAAELLCWLLPDGDFAVSIGNAALERRKSGELPCLAEVVNRLSTLAGGHSPA